MSTSDYEREILAWRAARVARLTANDSWLSLIGRFELPIGESTIGSDETSAIQLPVDKAPPSLGRLVRVDERVEFAPAAASEVGVQRVGSRNSEPVSRSITLTTDARGEPDRLVFGPLRIEIMQRGTSFAVRVRDTESAALQSFAGIEYFPIRPEWRVTARLIPYQPEKRIDMVYESGDPEPYRSPGAAIFERDGVEFRIDPVFDGSRPRLYVVFGDQTNRDESYGAGRFLYAPLPADGQVVLDFNQAFSPPCAFTPFAVCPLPPPQNRLALRVNAGEKRPR
jgi:uncharacterized protein (DUF1684 family)